VPNIARSTQVKGDHTGNECLFHSIPTFRHEAYECCLPARCIEVSPAAAGRSGPAGRWRRVSPGRTGRAGTATGPQGRLGSWRLEGGGTGPIPSPSTHRGENTGPAWEPHRLRPRPIGRRAGCPAEPGQGWGRESHWNRELEKAHGESRRGEPGPSQSDVRPASTRTDDGPAGG
jgi:hypothetical protein